LGELFTKEAHKKGTVFIGVFFEANQTTLGDISTIISANLDLIE